jgi:NAD(P)-dependent dehydrogenase (short-subunit alcohol dehydrogenase family)
LTNERWQRCIDVNLTGYFFLARDAGRVMIDQRSGVILNVASMAGLAGVPENIGYVASKHGVVGLTRSLAVDWARYGIRVNALCPGITETALIRQREAEAPEMFRARKERIPLGRVAQPVEQSRVGLFLLSDDASYVSGLVANVDAGGFALYSGFVAPKIAN